MLEEYTIEIASAIPPPINLQMCDSFNCPICDSNLLDKISISLKNFEVDDKSSVYCENCELKIKFKIVKI